MSLLVDYLVKDQDMFFLGLAIGVLEGTLARALLLSGKEQLKMLIIKVWMTAKQQIKDEVGTL